MGDKRLRHMTSENVIPTKIASIIVGRRWILIVCGVGRQTYIYCLSNGDVRKPRDLEDEEKLAWNYRRHGLA